MEPENDSFQKKCPFYLFDFQVSNEKKHGWLGFIGDYTTQLYWDYNKPL